MINLANRRERKKFDALLDRIIPACPERGIPGAGEAGIGEFLQQRAQTDNELAAGIRMILEQLEESASTVSIDLVHQIENEFPEAFAALVVATYMGYYSRADIRPHFGVGAHPVHPAGYPVSPETPEQLTRLTAPVLERGNCYRDV